MRMLAERALGGECGFMSRWEGEGAVLDVRGEWLACLSTREEMDMFPLDLLEKVGRSRAPANGDCVGGPREADEGYEGVIWDWAADGGEGGGMLRAENGGGGGADGASI